MLEEVACLKMLWVVAVAEFEFELQNWRPKFQDWFAVLPLSGPHPMRILQIRNETSLPHRVVVYRYLKQRCCCLDYYEFLTFITIILSIRFERLEIYSLY